MSVILKGSSFFQIQTLTKIAKTNFVVAKLLLGGHKKDSKVSGHIGWTHKGLNKMVTVLFQPQCSKHWHILTHPWGAYTEGDIKHFIYVANGYIVLKICAQKNFLNVQTIFVPTSPVKMIYIVGKISMFNKSENHLPSRACNHKSLLALRQNLHARGVP